MEKKSIIIIFLAVLIALTLIVTTILLKLSLAPETTLLEECHTLSYNSNSGTNIVFFSEKEKAEKYSSFLLKIKPFDKGKFNFFYIDNYKPECEIYDGIALLCYSKELIRKAGSCPNDYIVVIEEKTRDIRSSSYMNVLSLNSKHPLNVFPHEFAHAFAFLADEYVPSTLPRNSKNCVKNCKEFLGINEECFEGCSKDNYYRSINNGLMRTLSSNEYGKFNEKLISETLENSKSFLGPKNPKGFFREITEQQTTITGKAIEQEKECLKEKYYLIEGIYKQEIAITGKTIETGCVGKNGAGNFQYNLVMEDNTITKGESFNPELIFTDKEGEEIIEGNVLENSGLFLLKVPIIKEAKSLEILKNNKKITEINLLDINSRPCKK